MSTPLLKVSDLHVSFATEEGTVKAVDGVSFELRQGEILSVVGESGCGKSVTALTVMGLSRGPNAKIEGEVNLDGKDLVTLPENPNGRSALDPAAVGAWDFSCPRDAPVRTFDVNANEDFQPLMPLVAFLRDYL